MNDPVHVTIEIFIGQRVDLGAKRQKATKANRLSSDRSHNGVPNEIASLLRKKKKEKTR